MFVCKTILTHFPFISMMEKGVLSCILTSSPLLGQPDLSEISTHFRAGSDTRGAVPYVVLTIVPILVGLGLTALYQHSKGVLPGTRAADKLFAELCKAHGLTRGEIRLLRQMAKTTERTDAAEMFVLQQRFDEAAEAYRELEEQTKTAAAIDSLRGRLFGCEPADMRPS